MSLSPDTLFKDRTCLDCGVKIENALFAICNDCADTRLSLARATSKKQAGDQKARQWLEICPPTYRQTDWSNRTLAFSCAQVAAEWHPGDSGRLSLALFGPTGIGKTRAGFSILGRLRGQGYSVYAVHAGDAWDHGEHVQGVSSAARLQHSDQRRMADAATECLRRARSAGILLLDDLGKERTGQDGVLSEAVSEAFFGLIESRISRSAPIIWTCNMGAADLVRRLGPDRGEAALRRLLEFSHLPDL